MSEEKFLRRGFTRVNFSEVNMTPTKTDIIRAAQSDLTNCLVNGQGHFGHQVLRELLDTLMCTGSESLARTIIAAYPQAAELRALFAAVDWVNGGCSSYELAKAVAS